MRSNGYPPVAEPALSRIRLNLGSGKKRETAEGSRNGAGREQKRSAQKGSRWRAGREQNGNRESSEGAEAEQERAEKEHLVRNGR